MADRLSTGIDAIDRQVGGGIAAGSVVALRMPPETQGEILLRELASIHESIYLSTTRTEASVRRWLGDVDGVDVRYVGGGGLFTHGDGSAADAVDAAAGTDDGWSWQADDGEPAQAGTDGGTTVFDDSGPGESADPVESAVTAIESSGVREGCIVVDPVNPLEQGDRGRYKRFLHWLQQDLVATDSVAFLHLVDTPDPPEVRWLTLQVADDVWELSVDTHNEQIEFRLALTKSRGGMLPDRRIKLELGQDVTVDTSRDIA